MTFTHDLTTPHTENWNTWLSQLKEQPVTGLEIGCYQGQSSIWFCQNILTHPEARLICVDPFVWDNAQPVFEANIKEAGLEDKIDLKVESSKWLRLPANSLSFVYVDGDHSQETVLSDAVLSWKSLKKGGVMIFDDYLLERNNRMEVKAAVDAFLRVYARQLRVIHQKRQVAIIKTK